MSLKGNRFIAAALCASLSGLFATSVPAQTAIEPDSGKFTITIQETEFSADNRSRF